MQIQSQNWDVAVYNRRGSLSPLIVLDVTGPGRYDFASWLALASLYAKQGETEKALQVREAICEIDPYFDLDCFRKE